MRTLIAALAALAALATVAACGTGAAGPGPTPSTSPAPTVTAPAVDADAAVSTSTPTATGTEDPGWACRPSVMIVDIFRERVESAATEHAGNRPAMRRALSQISNLATAAYRTADWREAMGYCTQYGDRGDAAELHMWTVDLSLAVYELTYRDPDVVMPALLDKLDAAVTLVTD